MKIFLKFIEPFFSVSRLMGERGREMNDFSVKKRVNIDRRRSLDITVSEEKKTVITELITPDEAPIMIYAEKFDEPCDYLKKGIRRGFEYLNFSNPAKEDIWKSINKG